MKRICAVPSRTRMPRVQPATPASARTARPSDEPRKGEGSGDEATVDPQLIGTANDYQLSVAVKELRDRAAERGVGDRAQLPGNR